MAEKIKGITIEFQGDTTKLDKALADAGKQSKNLAGELKSVNQLLKLDPGNTEAIAQKQKILSEAVGVTKDRLDALKSAQQQVNDQFAKGEISEDQYRAFNRDIEFTSEQLKNLEKDLKNTGDKFKEFGDKAQEIGGKVKGAGEAMSLGITAPIAAIAAGSMAAWGEVDEALDGIISKTGATGEAADELADSFENVASRVPAGLDEVGSAVGAVSQQFGLIGPALDEASEYLLKFSAITGSDVAASADAAKSAMEAMGVDAGELTNVLDQVAKASQDTGVSTDKIFEVIRKGAPQLKDMGLSLGDAAQMLAQMDKAGIDSAQAMSMLAKARASFAKDGREMTDGLAEFKEHLADVSVGAEQVSVATEVFGTKGGAMMLDAINRGALDLEKFAGAAENAAGTVGNTFEATLDPVDNAALAMNNLKLAGADLGTAIQETLAPALAGMANGIKEFSQWFRDLPAPVKEMIVVLGGLAAAIGPILIVLGTLISSVGTIATAIGAAASGAGAALGGILAALGPVGLAIGAVVAAGVLLWQNWDTIKEKAGELGDWLGSTWEGIKTGASDAWEGLKESTSEAWNSVKESTSKTWGDIKEAAGPAWEAIKGDIKGQLDNINTAYKEAGGGWKGTLAASWQAIKESAGTQWEGIKTLVTGVANTMGIDLGDSFDRIEKGAAIAFDNLKKAISDKITEAKNKVSSIVSEIKGFFTGLKLEMPKIQMPKLPHFELSGKFSLNPPTVPKLGIKWYDQGGIFSAPTVIGVGEKRPEFVGALDDLRKIVREESKPAEPSFTLIVQGNVIADDENQVKGLMERMKRELRLEYSQLRAAKGRA